MLFFIEEFSRKKAIQIMLLVGLVQVAAYYIMGATIRSDGGFAIGQPDTLLYCQAARRIVEGQPFSFSANTAVSTGTTSVLYPFLLSIPYFLGATGDALIRVGFIINAGFYLLFLYAWGRIFSKVFPERSIALATSTMLTALFGPFAYCAMAQSDTGLWMALSAFIAWGLVEGNRRLYVPLLIMAPWVRPEGMMLCVFWSLFASLRLLLGCANCLRLSRKEALWEFGFSLLGVLSLLTVFFLNFALTGHAQFSSVANKGYFTHLPFLQAIYAVAIDGIQIAKAYIFGVPTSSPRDMMFVPVLGAAFMWIGIFVRGQRKISWREWVWLFSILAGVFSVSTSGYQDCNLDRYLAWTWPLILMFMAEGCSFVSRRWETCGWSFLPSFVHVVFTAVMAVVFVGAYQYSADVADRHRAFAEHCETVMKPHGSVGVWNACGVAYEFSARRVVNLCGVYSPEFDARSPAAALEILKNEPATRFEYYLYGKEDRSLWGDAGNAFLPSQVLVGPDGYELRRACWDSLDAAVREPIPPKEGLSLVDRVDVGYERDEKAHGYDYLSVYHMPNFAPFIVADNLKGEKVVDGGRLVFGGDEMTIRVMPGKDLYVIMRTCSRKCVGFERDLDRRMSFDLKLNEFSTLSLSVDGVRVGETSVAMPTNGLSDISFSIPGPFIKNDCSVVTIEGAHITCGYWFYQ